MKLNLKEKFVSFIQKKDSRKKIIIIAAVLGILLILLSEINIPVQRSAESVDSGDYAEYVNNLNSELM